MCLWKTFICTVCSFIHHSCIRSFNNCYADSTLPFQLNNQDKAPHLLGKPSSWGPHCPHHLLRTQQREAFRIAVCGVSLCTAHRTHTQARPGGGWGRAPLTAQPPPASLCLLTGLMGCITWRNSGRGCKTLRTGSSFLGRGGRKGWQCRFRDCVLKIFDQPFRNSYVLSLHSVSHTYAFDISTFQYFNAFNGKINTCTW